MPFDALRFCIDFNTPHRTLRKGWVQMNCPFCTGSQQWHLGIQTEKSYAFCWRCKWHPLDKVVEHFARVSSSEAKRLILKYGGSTSYMEPRSFPEVKMKRKRTCPLPENIISPMPRHHKDYLEKRGFDPDKLIQDWSLLGTGPTGFHKLRIVAPILYHKRRVSYQCRDITNQAKLKYITASKEEEAVHHKNILYGLDFIDSTAVVVEGVFDVWKLGAGAVATFGTSWTTRQLAVLSQLSRVFILYDSEEPDAADSGRKLAWSLDTMGVAAEMMTLSEGDPGELNQETASHLMKDLGFRR